MNKLAHKWLAHPAGKLVLAVTASTALLLAPVSARADTEFADFAGVPEDLGLRALALDMDWSWSWLGLLVLVAALVVTDRLTGKKRKD